VSFVLFAVPFPDTAVLLCVALRHRFKEASFAHFPPTPPNPFIIDTADFIGVIIN